MGVYQGFCNTGSIVVRVYVEVRIISTTNYSPYMNRPYTRNPILLTQVSPFLVVFFRVLDTDHYGSSGLKT